MSTQTRRQGNEVTGYWEWLADPDEYDIVKAVRVLDFDQLTTKGFPIGVGQSLIIWKAKGGDSTRGVVAFAEVISNPTPLDAGEGTQFWQDPADAKNVEDRVKVRYVPLPNALLLPNNRLSELKNLNVERARGGTVFYSDREKFLMVARLAKISDEYMIRNRLIID